MAFTSVPMVPRTEAWPSSFTWAGATPRAVSTIGGAVEVLAITTFDGGTTWRGDCGLGGAAQLGEEALLDFRILHRLVEHAVAIGSGVAADLIKHLTVLVPGDELPIGVARAHDAQVIRLHRGVGLHGLPERIVGSPHLVRAMLFLGQ